MSEMKSTSFELANELFGKKRAETKNSSNTVSQLTGVALTASEGGKVSVQLDETGETVELASTPAVAEGDHVVITASGGNLKTLSVTENAGAGDKAKAETDEAKKVATNYIDIDENKGITVGNMMDETLGKNTYIDANGFSIRDGETCLAHFKESEIALAENARSGTLNVCDSGFIVKTISVEDEYDTNRTTTLAIKDGASIKLYYVEPTKGSVGGQTSRAIALDCTDFSITATMKDSKQTWKDITSYLCFSPRDGLDVDGVSVSMEGHTHSADDITSGTLPVERGGTGKTSGTFYGETTLYSNDTAEAGADAVCTVSSWSDLSALRIEFKDNTGLRGSTTISNPAAGDTITLSTQYVDSGTLATKTRNVTLGAVSDGKATITTQAQGMSQIFDDGTASFTADASRIAITKVVGLA